MATIAQLEAVERDFRELVLSRSDLPDPDRVEFGEDEVTFLWEGRKLAVVVEVD
ncbi:MAG: hypothetical protein QOG63_2837, partial [Thermoleophilaceae bacterium]|nr:hypothetical protein [Thermoleophilaceae bacterium]